MPGRIILWLDEPLDRSLLPAAVRRLELRGLEVAPTRHLGPHNKYFPYVDTVDNLDQPLITADDDVLYPKDWVAGLMSAYRRTPSMFNCYRAHVLRITEGSISNYTTWSSCNSSQPSFLHFATAVAGSILPPSLLRRLKTEGTAFTDLCPTADDIWLHINAVREGIRIRQVRPWQRNFPEIPGTQTVSLAAINVHGSQNDVQIARTYTAEDLAVLEREMHSSLQPR